MTISPRSLTFVVGHRVIQFDVEALDSQSVEVQVRMDGERVWKFEEPSWGNLGFGFVDDRLYWWSARRLVILPRDGRGDVESVDVDEDVFFVFPQSDTWLIVCETSAHLYSSDGEISRLDFQDVVNDARWDDGRLMIQIEAHPELELVVDESGLSGSFPRNL
jgi:hypothetical protein